MRDAASVDRDRMALALSLAKRGAGWVNPNPMVGCVIVKDDVVIGIGYHKRFGGAHAEREALSDAARSGNDVSGSTVYVTLEPCSHTGKTPPCCDALIEAGVSRVVIGSSDPNPLVAGDGIARLIDAGIEVDTGVLEEECDALNAAFFHFITTRSPYVIAKFASTLDGKMATREGLSRWITGPMAREHVHGDRAACAAIMVGVGTVIADDPRLSARPSRQDLDAIDIAGYPSDSCVLDPHPGVHQPTRVIVDTHLRTPLGSNVVSSATEQPTLIATCVSDEERHLAYKERGCEIIILPKDDQERVDLVALFDALGSMGIDSVYVEGGPTLLGALFDLWITNRVDAYIAPKLFGGASAPSPIKGKGVSSPDLAFCLKAPSIQVLGDDILVSGEIDEGYRDPDPSKVSGCS